jgi:UDP-N-acetylmuramate--alanine ligase
MEFYSDPEAEQVLIDDFAHHPSEIRATLSAVRERYPTRLVIALFQAHTYTRTRTFLKEFSEAFDDADEVLILPIFASQREAASVITAAELVAAIAAVRPHVRECASIEDAIACIQSNTKTPSVVVALGAGEQWRVVDALRASSVRGE